MRRRAAITLLLGSLALFASACPRGSRCATIDDAPKDALVARCVALACPPDAKPDGNGGCVCNDGADAFFGACLGANELPRFCGDAARPSAAGCAFVRCAPGDVLDRASGVCLPLGSQRGLAKALGVGLYDTETLGCDSDQSLVASGHTAGCAKPTDTCGVGMHAVADAGACVAVPTCGPGTLYSAADGRCLRVLSSFDDAPLVDVALWLRAAIGPDGGEGTTTVCAPLRDDVRLAGASEQTFDVEVELRALANETTNADLRLKVEVGLAPSEAARGLVEHGLRPVVTALRALGGLTNAASATVRVHCPVHLWGRPFATPIPELDGGPAKDAGH